MSITFQPCKWPDCLSKKIYNEAAKSAKLPKSSHSAVTKAKTAANVTIIQRFTKNTEPEENSVKLSASILAIP